MSALASLNRYYKTFLFPCASPSSIFLTPLLLLRRLRLPISLLSGSLFPSPSNMCQGDTGRQQLDLYGRAYNAVMEKVAADYSSQKTGDKQFTVVYQPAVTDLNITYLGESYLSGLDCFHPAIVGG